ncbi:MAG: hypothetical protein GEV06_12570 [Luteitalea sp.]|nr:hypothetical protein [Luteitalea sp.]
MEARRRTLAPSVAATRSLGRYDRGHQDGGESRKNVENVELVEMDEGTSVRDRGERQITGRHAAGSTRSPGGRTPARPPADADPGSSGPRGRRHERVHISSSVGSAAA